MRSSIQLHLPTVLVTLLAAGGLFLAVSQPAASNQAGNAPTKWNYNSLTVEASTLPAKLTELGADGWDVFSVVPAESTVDGAGADGPKVIVNKYEVTCRKPMN